MDSATIKKHQYRVILRTQTPVFEMHHKVLSKKYKDAASIKQMAIKHPEILVKDMQQLLNHTTLHGNTFEKSGLKDYYVAKKADDAKEHVVPKKMSDDPSVKSEVEKRYGKKI